MTTLQQQMRAVHDAHHDVLHELSTHHDYDSETKKELGERADALLDAAETLSTLRVFGKFLDRLMGESK